MFGEIGDHAGNERKAIHEDVKGFAIVAKDIDKGIFTRSAKQVKRIHIKKQMRNIRVNKPVSDEAVVLIFLCYGGGVEDQVVHDFVRLKCK